MQTQFSGRIKRIYLDLNIQEWRLEVYLVTQRELF
jgi:hypothetical protein